jgi:transcriptional regulator with GAF, ATPase, and Fis domain
MQQTAPAYLIIQLGNRWTDILRLQPQQPVLVGRSSECQVVVKDERVSRKHAAITPQGGGWTVRDLGSRNGTRVDGQRISVTHRLTDGESIEVGGCLMTFSLGLSRAFSGGGRGAADKGIWSDLTDQHTQEMAPTITKRITGSQWSAHSIEWNSQTIDQDAKAEHAKAEPGRVRPAAPAAAASLDGSEHWSFFYRLISDLVVASSPESAAQVALDRLLDHLHLQYGGVVTIDPTSASPTAGMAVLAARQAAGGSYHRISDFLVQTVVSEKQAVLARNVQDDSKLSVARNSGQREIISILCAPLRTPTERGVQVAGLLHVYTAGDERMLTEADLEFAVGVADNLAIALSRQVQKEELTRSLENARRRAEHLQAQLAESTVMVGESRSLQQVRQAISKAGPTDATILVRGESGVGKELVARAIHQTSERHDGPLICLNCAALAPTLLESELFGHERGAFTGATEKKIGKFEAAQGGTLMLDEIGEMSPELQAKFLRVLEGQPFERLGGHKPIQTDVRVIAATNRDLEEAVQAKQFRADLYYRLRVIEVFVPPLRDRKEDIRPLVEHFVEQLRHHAARRLRGIAPEALELLMRHDWPGNVRELRNVIERAIVLGSSSTIQPEDLNLVSFRGRAPESIIPANSDGGFQPVTLAELEKQHILATLDFAGGNKTRASQLLGIERSTLDRKLKRY